MRRLRCYLYHNLCYKKCHNTSFQPTGIVVHSTDKAGKILKRFVQPHEGQTTGMEDNGVPVTAARMLEILGKNYNENDWNREKVPKAGGGLKTLEACASAFLGQCADGSYAVCETLPPTCPVWGAGTGPNGSYNGWIAGNPVPPLYIQFEMIEDSVGDKTHCRKLYELAVEYCAWLCVTYPTIDPDNIVSHKEAHDKGRGSNHGDPENYWKRCGMSYTMAGFRAAVKSKIEEMTELTENQIRTIVNEAVSAAVAPINAAQTTINKKLSELGTALDGLVESLPETVRAGVKAYLKEQEAAANDNDAAKWSKSAREWAIASGLTAGKGPGPDGQPNYAWESVLTFERFMTCLYRYDQIKAALAAAQNETPET